MNLLRQWKKVLINDLDSIAFEVSEYLEAPTVILLKGVVGAGKTTFTQAFIKSIDLDYKTSSPTYSIVNELGPILHADLYRLEDSSELDMLELPMLLEDKDYVFIEWPDNHQKNLLNLITDEFHIYCLEIELVDKDTRNFSFSQLS